MSLICQMNMKNYISESLSPGGSRNKLQLNYQYLCMSDTPEASNIALNIAMAMKIISTTIGLLILI